eukprot:GAFH01001545.1.p4 GENE.GAFH01001545.1~~GAFH01001545.1.p4  ORF type:complete len:120 (+),score=26.65 GAFH01001545.1:773-1132(+)
MGVEQQQLHVGRGRVGHVQGDVGVEPVGHRVEDILVLVALPGHQQHRMLNHTGRGWRGARRMRCKAREDVPQVIPWEVRFGQPAALDFASPREGALAVVEQLAGPAQVIATSVQGSIGG